MSERKIKVLALSSAGGHWVQLMRLKPAFEGFDVTYVTVNPGYQVDVGDAKFRVIPDGNRWDKVALLRSMLGSIWLLLRERPDVVISTGAAPGYFAIRVARLLRIRTIWVDSVANAETLSLSGQKVGRYADLWLTPAARMSSPRSPRANTSPRSLPTANSCNRPSSRSA
jgi:UDP-N-acetylglucosamine:LPS N-acetylglucosamine transferase